MKFQSFQGYLPASSVRTHGELQEALAMGAGLERRRAIAEIKRVFKNRLLKYKDNDGDIMFFNESDAVAIYDDSPRQDGRE